MTRVTCCQLAPQIADLEANRALALGAIRGAVAAGAEIVVLPELTTSGYCFDSREEAASVAVTPAHPLFGEWAAAAGDAVIAGGFCELGDDGLLYNSAALVDRDGEPGDSAPPAVETAFGSVGILICYDLEFPELTRSLALRGADLIVVPTNWPLVPRPSGEHPPEVIAAMAAARANHVFIACCDRAGEERGTAWTAGTVLVDEYGWVVAEADGDGVATADFDLSRARDKEIGPRNDVLADRRPELYVSLTDREDARV
jgi:5-aminopentanamidase